MKKIFSLVFSFIFILTVFSTPAKAAGDLVEVSQNKPFYMTLLGDSIAAGYGLEGYESDPCYTCKSYGNLLAEKYELVAQTDYHNLAVSGATSNDLVNLLKDKNASRIIKNSDTIIISIGGNDILHVLYDAISQTIDSSTESYDSVEQVISSLGISGIAKLKKYIDENLPIALEQYEKNLKLIISSIKAQNPSGIIIVQTIYNPFEFFDMIPAIKELSNSAISDFNKVIKKNATIAGAEYIVCDIASEFKGKSKELTRIGSLDIHPNEVGHQKIYEILDKELTSHTFTTWIIDTESDDSKTQSEAKSFLNVMTGFYFMLLISVAIIGVIFIKKMKEL